MFLYFFAGFGVAVNKSAASAPSPKGLQAKELDFQAMIKSAASAACRNPRDAHGRRLGKRTTGGGWAPLGFLEAAPAADLITAARSLLGRLR